MNGGPYRVCPSLYSRHEWYPRTSRHTHCSAFYGALLELDIGQLRKLPPPSLSLVFWIFSCSNMMESDETDRSWGMFFSTAHAKADRRDYVRRGVVLQGPNQTIVLGPGKVSLSFVLAIISFDLDFEWDGGAGSSNISCSRTEYVTSMYLLINPPSLFLPL